VIQIDRVPHMGHPHKDDIMAAYAAGTDVAAIEQLYRLEPGEVERIVAGQPERPAARQWMLHNTGNRIMLGVGTGFVVQIFAGLLGGQFGVQLIIGVVVAVLVYVVATPRS
jgi:hypothetical protein